MSEHLFHRESVQDTINMLRMPWVKALCSQFIGFLVAVLVAVSQMVAQIPGFAGPELLAVHSCAAAVAAFMLGLRGLWLPLNFFIPAALVFAPDLQVSQITYALLFTLFAAVLFSVQLTNSLRIVAETYSWRQVTDLIPKDRPVFFLHAGCGMGELVRNVALLGPVGVTGMGNSWISHLYGSFIGFLSGSYAVLLKRDPLKTTLSLYDAVFTSLPEDESARFVAKAVKEMRRGSRVISRHPGPNDLPCSFSITDVYGRQLYIWDI